MQKDVRAWFDSAVLTVGSPLNLGQTADQRKALLFENEVKHGMIVMRDDFQLL